jgi:hypothetical protein
MGFRDPITTASDVDTGRGPSDAGVRLYQDTSVPAVPIGVAEWRTGQMARNATAKLSGGGSGGSSFSIDGGASLAGLDAPRLNLNVEALPAGGYGSIARLRAETLDLGGADLVDLSGSGWQPLSLATGFASAGDCFYMRRAGWCTVVLTAVASAGWAANAPLLANPLPAGVAPQKTAWVAGNISGDSTRWALVTFQPSGQVRVVPAVTGGNDLRVAYTFPTI